MLFKHLCHLMCRLVLPLGLGYKQTGPVLNRVPCPLQILSIDVVRRDLSKVIITYEHLARVIYKQQKHIMPSRRLHRRVQSPTRQFETIPTDRAVLKITTPRTDGPVG